MTTLDRIGDRSFLNGGGDMGARVRAFDWTRTPLGVPETWPHGLKTAVRIMLTSRQPMWIGWGGELTYLYNDPYKAIIGGKHPRALGRPAADVWREIWADVGPLLATALSGDQGTYVEEQLLIMERNGYPEETYYTFSYSPIPDDDGRTGGIICANTDDTDRVVRERQLALLQQLAAAASDARTVADACALLGAALEANPRDVPFALLYLAGAMPGTFTLCARAGIPASHPAALGELSSNAGAPWRLAHLADTAGTVLVDLPDTTALPRGAWERPPRQAVAVPLRTRGQAALTGALIIGLNPFRLFDDAYSRFVDLVAGHVSAALDNGRAYEEERRRAEALAEIDRAKTVFFSNVSHEFRTPLTLMIGPTEAALQSPGRALGGEDLVMVHRNQLRLLKLVNTLLDFSRIEAGRASAHFEPTDLASFTRDLVSLFRSATERAGLRLVVDCPPVGVPVYVDPSMWEKIVLNLVSNAFKYTFDGEIEARLERVDRTVQFTVRDTGPGIPAQELPRIFDRFHRVEGARGRTHEGTGIGLALVHELVKLHGGTVSVASEVGAGTTFTVTLRLGAAHLPADHVVPAPERSTIAGSGRVFVDEILHWAPDPHVVADITEPDAILERGGAPAPAGADWIVLADDNSDMREYMRRLLATKWQVEAVANGREALAAIERRRPHVVVTDVMMPELDGFGLIAAMRADSRFREVPVVVVSARAGEEATIEGLASGADDYLVKPFSARELLARVEAQLLRARIRAVEERHARRVASIFEQAPVAIALVRGPSHVFELANPSYLALVGHRALIGRPLREALPELVDQGIPALLDAVYRSGEPYTGRSQRVRTDAPDGSSERFFDVVFQPLFDGGRDVEGIAMVVYEVTELARARRQAEIASRTKDEFLAMLGHELRNPLAPILTALQLLRLRDVQGAEKERQVIERQVRHLVTLVDDLLDVSRITRGKIRLNRADVEIADVVAKAIEIASPLLEQNRHELQVDVPRGLRVEGDSHRLEQVVSNLLTNAAKYTNPGGTIVVRASVADGTVAVEVRDTGIGIEPEMLSRIFDLFVQAPQALDRAHGGLGLGLAIVRSIVEMHGGVVEAHSGGRGHGSTFVVRLPSAVSALTSVPATPAVRSVPELPSAGTRVLVVDDNADAVDMLVEALGAMGYDVRSAHDGPSALAVVEQFPPDVALLDIGLPVMDGYELARRFRSLPALAGVRLIAVTGYGQEQDRERSAAAGFADHLVKPLDLAAVRSIVESEPRRR